MNRSMPVARFRPRAIVAAILSGATLLVASALAETEDIPAGTASAGEEQTHMPGLEPPPGFTPSESISADQAVAFPVDI